MRCQSSDAAHRPRIAAAPCRQTSTQAYDYLAEKSRGRTSLTNCGLQGDFQKLQGKPILLPVKFFNGFKMLEGVLPNLRSREAFLGIAGKSSLGLRMRARASRAERRAQIFRDHAGLALVSCW